MKGKVLETIKKNAMIAQGDRVVVGLSGGADSVALLCVLQSLESDLGIKLFACHVNHMLRGVESDADEQFCRDLCKRLKIPLTVRRVDVKGYCVQNRCGTEEGARVLRYDALLSAQDNSVAATAHTLSDNAETVIMNLARGAALEGLCGIPKVRERIIRPIIDCTRSEVEQYLASIGQTYVTDSTNLADAYTRNRVRHSIVPLLKGINPAFEVSVSRTVESLCEDRLLLSSLCEELIGQSELTVSQTVLPTGLKRLSGFCPQIRRFDLKKLKKAHLGLRLRLYKRLLTEFNQRCDNLRLKQIEALTERGGGLQLSKDFFVKSTQDMLEFRQIFKAPMIGERAVPIFNKEKVINVNINETNCLKISAILQQEIKFFVNNETFQFKNMLDCDRIKGTVVLRRRRAADRISLWGRDCTQTFKNLFNAAKIPTELRDSILVLCDDEGVIWLEGFGCDRRCAACESTEHAVSIAITEEN